MPATGDQLVGEGAGELYRGDEPLFSFTVPDELLQEAISKSRHKEAIADVALMPGVGEGKPPPLRAILRASGYAPLVLLTLAAIVPNMFGQGINLIGNNLEKSFHLHDAGLGAVAFVVSVAQLVWAVPLGLWADRGSRKLVSALSLLVFAVLAPLMALAPNVWWFVVLYLLAAVGSAVNNTVHNSYLSDAYPTEGRSRVFSWHYLNDPIAQTLGVLVFGGIVAVTNNWRWGLAVGALGIPIGLLLFRIREPDKGTNESSHILKAAGMDVHSEQEKAPRVLLGPAVTRLLRIRSLYYELVAVAVLGFVGVSASLFGNLYFVRVWHLHTASRSHVYAIIGLSAFIGLPIAYSVGDRLFRRNPQAPLVLAGICITVYGLLFTVSLYMPKLWLVVVFQFLANAAVAPIAIAIFQTLAATAPPEMRSICFAMFGVYSAVFGGFAGGIILGAISDASNVTTALTFIGPVCALGGLLLVVGSRFVRRDITLVIEDVLERYAEGKRRQSGGAIPALQIHNMDFYYGTQQVLFDVNLEVAEGDIVALLGTNGAGKSTLLRAVAGLDHPHRGVIRIFGTNCTYLEPEQIIDLGAALLVGGKMTFPGLTVRENLRIGEHSFRRDASRAKIALDDAVGVFPELESRLDQPAGTLSGGEQQMLALARVMMTKPRLLMIDELAFGLAPMTVERLMDIVRQVNADGATVILVEQSVNRAMTLAERAFFLERGEVRFEGSISELLGRDDLLRPVFLAGVGSALGNGATHHAGGGTGPSRTGSNGAGARSAGEDDHGRDVPGPNQPGPSASGPSASGPSASGPSGPGTTATGPNPPGPNPPGPNPSGPTPPGPAAGTDGLWLGGPTPRPEDGPGPAPGGHGGRE
ncbi:MAG TPA: ATP-binding protein [Acidimicrobiales bacterium]|nr:ATP-binding protein [Acidimicrobiales bacterium]